MSLYSCSSEIKLISEEIDKRIFDIENTCIILEKRFHKSDIKHLAFSKDGNILSVVDENCIYYLCDA